MKISRKTKNNIIETVVILVLTLLICLSQYIARCYPEVTEWNLAISQVIFFSSGLAMGCWLWERSTE